MIHKIIEIKNCGRFANYMPSEKDYGWNGIFSRHNTIYAENGSGKTTFTQILKSLSGKCCELVEKRKSLKANGQLKISIVTDNNNRLTYKSSNKWNSIIPNIEVYDSYYSESNIYIISLGDYESPSSFYDIIPNGNAMISEIKQLRTSRKNVSSYMRNIKRNIKGALTLNDMKKWDDAYRKQLIKKVQLEKMLNEKETLLKSNIEKIGVQYIEKANQHLREFNPNLEIKKANKKGNQLVYYINMDGVEVRSDSSNISLKHTLSEGDKSSLSLSFFLARLDMLPNIENKIIVFDDPISSFDTRRRKMTIAKLSRIANNAAQFFLLSHDINFVKDFCNRHSDCTNLKIVWKNGSSVFVNHDIKIETMTGISKDMYTLKTYLSDGALTDLEKREVIRCIRPVIEGIFRLKYFNIFADNEWLGNFLDHIRNSKKSSPLYRLKVHLNELSDINDYCKQYHHSNPNYMEEPIFDEELRQFVQRTLSILAYI